jgi:hypothetical protein
MRSIALIFVFGVGLAGCEADPNDPTPRDRQEAALRNPWDYSPYDKKTDNKKDDIGSFDREGMNRDLDSLLNP